MNRRSVLRFLSLAPIATPIAAALPKYASAGYVRGESFAALAAGESITPPRAIRTLESRLNVDTSSIDAAVARLRHLGTLAPMMPSPSPAIEAQMRDDDLFESHADPSDQVIAPNHPPTPPVA